MCIDFDLQLLVGDWRGRILRFPSLRSRKSKAENRRRKKLSRNRVTYDGTVLFLQILVLETIAEIAPSVVAIGSKSLAD